MRLHFPGGLNEQETPTLFEANSGYNFELGLRQSKFVPRKPFDLMGTATNAGAINGIMQLVKRDATETTLIQSDETVYLWDGSTTFTSKATVATDSRLRGVYWSLDDYLLIVDVAKQTKLYTWDATTFSSAVTGLGTDFYAKYGVIHQGRAWFANVKTTTDTPHLIAVSAFENPKSLDTSKRASVDVFTAATSAFYLLSPDLKPINGLKVFYDELVISTEDGRLFKLTGSDASDYTFTDFYAGSAATGDESMENIGNDVIFMKSGGNIDLLSSTEKFGDVSADDVSRWIPDTVKNLTGAITVYDQVRQKVLFFVSGKVLVLYKDLVGAELSPWSVYKTQETFNFDTNAAAYIKIPGTANYSVYFGDSAGRIFDLNGSAGSGDVGATNISVLRKTRYISNGEGGDKSNAGALNLMSRVLSGLVVYRRVSTSSEVTLSFDWGDEYNESSSIVLMKGAPTADVGYYYGLTSYYNGTAYYNSGGAFAKKISSQTFSPTGKGPGFFLSLSLDTKADFQIDSIELG